MYVQIIYVSHTFDCILYIHVVYEKNRRKNRRENKKKKEEEVQEKKSWGHFESDSLFRSQTEISYVLVYIELHNSMKRENKKTSFPSLGAKFFFFFFLFRLVFSQVNLNPRLLCTTPSDTGIGPME